MCVFRSNQFNSFLPVNCVQKTTVIFLILMQLLATKPLSSAVLYGNSVNPATETKVEQSIVQISTASNKFLRAFVSDDELQRLELSAMTSTQKTALAMLVGGYYYAGLSNAVQDGTIKGTFKGWKGDTLVELTDGTIFKQTEPQRSIEFEYYPDVTIFSDFHEYKLQVNGTDEIVTVDLVSQLSKSRISIRHHENIKQWMLKNESEDVKSSHLVAALIPETEGQILKVSNLNDTESSVLVDLLFRTYYSGMSTAIKKGSIKGEFEGWEGDTLVELTDGSVFKQIEFHYEYLYAYNPDVLILVKPLSIAIFVEGTREYVAVELVSQTNTGQTSLIQHQYFQEFLGKLKQDDVVRLLTIGLSLL